MNKTTKASVQRERDRSQARRSKRDQDVLVKRILQLERQVELFEELKGYKPRLLRIPPPAQKVKGEATAVVQWSDWHVEEKVDPKLVDGRNAYSPAIAEARVARMVRNMVKLIDTQRSSVNIPHLVLQLGGDFITGFLHEELAQTNALPPMEAVEFAADLIISGIEYLLDHGRFKHIVIIANRGNHGRITKKMQFKNDNGLNMETLLYSIVKRHFKNCKKISWQPSRSAIVYFEVYGHTLRFLHGHQIKFKGGIGGMTVPMYKAVHRWNDTRKAAYNFICDKHVYSTPLPDAQVNGALKGYDELAAEWGLKFQPPFQSLTLIDSERFVTIKAPIFCD